MYTLKYYVDINDILISTVLTDSQPEPQLPVTSASAVPNVPQLPSSDALAAVAQLFQSPHGQEVI